MLVSALLLIGGVLLLIAGSELLVRAVSGFAGRLQLTGYVYGLTVVALATNAPEFVTLTWYAVRGDAATVLAELLGSAHFNFLFVLGLGAVVGSIRVDETTLWRTFPMVMLCCTALYPLSYDLRLDRADGFMLIVAGVAMVLFVVRNDEDGDPAPPVTVPPTKLAGLMGAGALVVSAGAGLVVSWSDRLEAQAGPWAQLLATEQSFLGITVLAISTSLPEVVAVVVAALGKQSGVLVGTIVGSCAMNFSLGLGVATVIAPLDVQTDFVSRQLPALVFVLVVVFPILRANPWRSTPSGVLLVAGYLAFVVGVASSALDAEIGWAMPVMAVLLTLAVLTALAARLYEQGRQGRGKGVGD